MCLDLWELASLKEKVRPDEERHPLTSSERQSLEPLMDLDLALHRHFTASLESRVAEFGASKMELFKQQLDNINEYAETKCRVERELDNGVWKAKTTR